jgi:oxalate decarboxylase/phosphoglucose isomerase-like protein (cupin superfamily)
MIKGQKVDLKANSAYHQWVESQGIPVLREFYIEDLRKLKLSPWSWKRARGVYLNLIGTGDVNDAYVLEIAPGLSIAPQRYLFEEIYFVLEGSGATAVWNDVGKKITFEWQAGSLFSPPANTWRQHFNGSGQNPARLLSVTTAPVLFNLFRDTDFILNNNHRFKARFDEEQDSFSGAGESYRGRRMQVWDTNFVADVRTLPLHRWDERGPGAASVSIELAENSLTSHISEFPVGTYKKAHRHGPGAHVIIIGGQGYSLMWPEGEQPKRFDWHDGSVVVPPERWFHQHFNTGPTPARYLAIRWGSQKYPRPWQMKSYGIDESVKRGGAQIEFEDEDPMIRQVFEQELARNGLQSRMDYGKKERREDFA